MQSPRPRALFLDGMALNTPRLSPLAVADGFAWGWATDESRQPVPVHLYVDGRHVATEFTGVALPVRFHRLCGKPAAVDAGFAFALPSALFDGFAHDIHVALPTAEHGGLHGAVLSYRSGAVCGEVRQQGRQFVGSVWFSSRPAGKPVLQVVDERGKTVHSQPLAALATVEEHGYPARFTVQCDGLPEGPLGFRCNGQALRGSPCERAQSLVGVLDDVAGGRIKGWALDGADWLNPLELVLRVDGQAVAWFRPNVRRPDISKYLGLPDEGLGLAGFELPAPQALADGRTHVVEVVSAVDGQLLKNGRQRVQLPRAGLAWGDLPARLRRPSADTPATVPATPRRDAARRGPHPTPVVSVIILNRNGQAVLDAFLQSWLAHNVSVPAEIIVVDHASTDGSLALLRQWRGRLDLQVLALDHNGSFSQSCNLGARHARGQYLLFMNNDIVWLQDALPRMLESLHEPQVGAVGIKLLKAVGGGIAGMPVASEVQHLGVRFKLNDKGYWPFEVTPSVRDNEAEYSPQYVPAVTGAVLLCRKVDFEEVGGFDPAYFYGFEDVELCLRLAYRLRKAVVCRNDCVALHRHGHTRLSGREMSIFDRVMRNSAVLESHIGVWIKQAYWRSLVRGDGYITREPLAIGIVVDASPQTVKPTPMVRDALELGRHISAALPHARLVLMAPGHDWKDAQDLHVLVVGDARYDIRTLRRARPDLLTLAWLHGAPMAWRHLPWWDAFGSVLVPAARAARVGKVLGMAVQASSPDMPLGDALGAARWRLRVAVHAQTGARADAQALQRRLRVQGLPCWVVEDGGVPPPWMADLCITMEGVQDGQAPAALGAGVLHVAWPAGSAGLPDVAWLEKQMETRVGNTFRSS